MSVPKSTWLAVAVSFGALLFAAFGWPSTRAGQTDFRSFYAGARLAGTPELYSAAAVYEIQRQYSPAEEVKAFIRPPFYALLLWPLGRLPYGAAHAVWQLLNLAALAGFLLLWSPRAVSAILCCWFFPTWVSFIVGQDVPVILFLVALAAHLLGKGRHLAAGLVVALCAAKFHLFLLLPLLVAAKRLWRFAAGLLAGGMALAGISFAVAGWDWPARQWELLKLSERAEASQSYMPNLNGLFHGVPYGTALLAVATLVVVWAAWYVIRRSPLRQALAAMLCAGLLVGFHGFLYDCAILLPFFVLFAERAGFERAAVLWAATGLFLLTLTTPASAVGQLALVVLFGFIVFRTRQATRGDAEPKRGPA